ncbi:MAG: immunoglobulin domain-containing protein [Verrucomicrobia bacterium]|nr:immunoglobulin domain-containing protein [Verrucomicrobiota bacterium]
MKTHKLINSAFVAVLFVALWVAKAPAGTVYRDTFQSYPVQAPAPNPLTNGPAGGQWFYVDPTPPTIGNNEHRIFDSGTGGSGLQSRVWISTGNDAKLTNAISIPTLPAGTNVHTFTMSFLAATDTTTLARIATFHYEIGSSGESLGFVSGGNLDGSQVFSGLSGFGTASAGAKGKTDDRKFKVVFTATNITTSDKIYFNFTRITNAGAAGVFMALDDVAMEISFGPPLIVQEPQSVSAQAGDLVNFSAVVENFPDSYQWTKNGSPIPGATSSSYTIPFVTKPDEGTYVLLVENSEGATNTVPATLTVTDNTPPTVANLKGLLTLEHVRVRFSEPIETSSALQSGNYTISGGAIQSVTLHDSFTVDLFTTPLNPNTLYTVTVSGVQDLGGNTIAPGSSSPFTTPALVISPVRYNAGTTTSHPSGPPDPMSEQGGSWAHIINTNAGISTMAVIDDLGTGFNAWKITDQNVSSTSGALDYRLGVDPASDNIARANGWRLLIHSRMITDFFGGTASPVVLYSDPGNGRRYGIFFDLNANGELTAQLLGGSTYVLTGDALSYHTHMLVYDPATTNASYYFDGQLITSTYIGDANTAADGVIFGVASSAGTGEMNFNRVQLDVIGGIAPTLVSSPQNSTNGVGQKATFTVQFTPFVAGYQWLSNGVVIPGAVSNVYTTDFLTLDMNGTQYRARALHAFGNVETATASLTVTSDTQPPTIASVKGSLLLDRLTITFSEPVLEEQATNLSNYVWVNPGIANISAIMVDPITVELRTTSQQQGSNYTVLVSNIRDTSNLVIANNSSASYKSPGLNTVARYDAGTTTTRPSGPPAPNSVDGGSWLNNSGTDPNLITGPVPDDIGSGWHGWQVTDQTSASGQFIQYNIPMTPEQHLQARNNGWVMSIRGRFVEDFNSGVTVISQYGDSSGNRFLFWFDLVNGDLLMRPQGGTDRIVTSGGAGASEYHLHQFVFDPDTENTSYYFNGDLIFTTWTGDVSVAAYSGVLWGTGSSPNQGSMNFNLVEFNLVTPPTPPSVAATRNGNNIDILYTGILETATSLSGNSAWTGVATNASPTPALISVPATAPEQYFRARSAD